MNYFVNEYKKRRFTEILEELVSAKKMDLKAALSLMARALPQKKEAVAAAAQNIYGELLNGQAFSNALKLCPYIDFDMVYISFTAFAERCGCLEKALEFLKKKCLRQSETMSALTGAAVYPIFVVLLALAAGILLCFYSDLKSSFYEAFAFLLFFCIIAFPFYG